MVAQPEAFAIIHRDTRRALIPRRFPYGIFYRTYGDTIVVVACMHARGIRDGGSVVRDSWRHRRAGAWRPRLIPDVRHPTMEDVPKRIKRLLREAGGAAHEEELRRALLPVAEAFKRWEAGQLGSGELSEIIHRFHQGPARELFLRYNTPYLDLSVAHAIVTGVLDRGTVPADLLEHLAGALELYESEAAPADLPPREER